MSKDFNGYSFDDKATRKRMKYLVITDGDLDLNNAYAFRTKKELRDYLKDPWNNVVAVFEVKDITDRPSVREGKDA